MQKGHEPAPAITAEAHELTFPHIVVCSFQTLFTPFHVLSWIQHQLIVHPLHLTHSLMSCLNQSLQFTHKDTCRFFENLKHGLWIKACFASQIFSNTKNKSTAPVISSIYTKHCSSLLTKPCFQPKQRKKEGNPHFFTPSQEPEQNTVLAPDWFDNWVSLRFTKLSNFVLKLLTYVILWHIVMHQKVCDCSW